MKMKTRGRAEVTIVEGTPTIRRVVTEIEYIGNKAYGVIVVNRLKRVVRQSEDCETKHWSRDKWILSDIYNGHV